VGRHWMGYGAVVMVVAAELNIGQQVNTLGVKWDSYLNMMDGLVFWSKKLDASALRVFSYPSPAPRRIVPFSLKGPQSVPSGLDSGIWVNKTVGWSYFSDTRSKLALEGLVKKQELTD
jgi:hypothetical protein